MNVRAENINTVLRKRLPKEIADILLKEIKLLQWETMIKERYDELNEEFREVAIKYQDYISNEKRLRQAKMKDAEIIADSIEKAFEL